MTLGPLPRPKRLSSFSLQEIPPCKKFRQQSPSSAERTNDLPTTSTRSPQSCHVYVGNKNSIGSETKPCFFQGRDVMSPTYRKNEAYENSNKPIVPVKLAVDRTAIHSSPHINMEARLTFITDLLANTLSLSNASAGVMAGNNAGSQLLTIENVLSEAIDCDQNNNNNNEVDEADEADEDEDRNNEGNENEKEHEIIEMPNVKEKVEFSLSMAAEPTMVKIEEDSVAALLMMNIPIESEEVCKVSEIPPTAIKCLQYGVKNKNREGDPIDIGKQGQSTTISEDIPPTKKFKIDE